MSVDATVWRMTGDIAVDVEQLRRSGGQLRRLGEEIAGRQGGWNADLRGSGAVWGADEEGAAFGRGYQDVTDVAGELFSALAEALDTVGTNLTVMADNLDAADQASQERFQAVLSKLNRFE